MCRFRCHRDPSIDTCSPRGASAGRPDVARRVAARRSTTRRSRRSESAFRAVSTGSVAKRGSRRKGPLRGRSSKTTRLSGPTALHRDPHPRHPGGAEADLELHHLRAPAIEHHRRIVQFGDEGPDRVVEPRSDGRPVRVDAADPAGADDPARVGVGVVQHVEHRLRAWRGSGSSCGPCAQSVPEPPRAHTLGATASTRTFRLAPCVLSC